MRESTMRDAYAMQIASAYRHVSLTGYTRHLHWRTCSVRIFLFSGEGKSTNRGMFHRK